jgi:hypothetical protein
MFQPHEAQSATVSASACVQNICCRTRCLPRLEASSDHERTSSSRWPLSTSKLRVMLDHLAACSTMHCTSTDESSFICTTNNTHLYTLQRRQTTNYATVEPRVPGVRLSSFSREHDAHGLNISEGRTLHVAMSTTLSSPTQTARLDGPESTKTPKEIMKQFAQLQDMVEHLPRLSEQRAAAPLQDLKMRLIHHE